LMLPLKDSPGKAFSKELKKSGKSRLNAEPNRCKLSNKIQIIKS